MTQTQLADQLGVTDKAVSKWERDLSIPDLMLFPRLADLLGVTINDLLRECKDGCRPSKLLQVFELSRDIRTPLHIMLGFVEMAKQDRDNPELLRRDLESITVSGEYLMTLLNGILEDRCGAEERPQCCENYPEHPQELEQYLQAQVNARLKRQEAFDFSGKRILIVDDMVINREIAEHVLEQTGALTETAKDGNACLRMVETMPAGYYDLILMDIIMPVMDGLEATKKIRALSDPRKADIPIVAMTTSVSQGDRTAAAQAGMNDFAEKPIFVEKLFETLSRYLEHPRVLQVDRGQDF